MKKRQYSYPSFLSVNSSEKLIPEPVYAGWEKYFREFEVKASILLNPFSQHTLKKDSRYRRRLTIVAYEWLKPPTENMNVKKSLTDKEKNMFIRMKESKGFTLVELMIVVAIIGILAAVAVPYYQKYIQKARLTSKVIPGVHSIQTDLATYFSFQGVFPTQDTTLTPMYSDANTHCFTPKYTGSSATAGFQISFTIVSSGCTSLQTLWGQVITATPILANTGQTVTGWNFGGNLAASMGLSGSQ